jgi:hypothetical protein
LNGASRPANAVFLKRRDEIMFEPKIRINKALYELVEQKADEEGYSSIDEYVTHILEKAVANAGENASEEEIRERLRGLGYLK